MRPHTKDLQPKIRFIDRPELLRRIPLTYPVIWTMMCQNRFPRSVLIGKNRTVWVESEVDEWMLEQANSGRRILKGDTAPGPKRRFQRRETLKD